jgi:hypothetical protein
MNEMVDWDDNQQFKHWLTEELRNNIVTVVFTKKDGTERVMKCTLKSDVVVPYEQKTERKKVQNEEIVSVWDVEKNAWRSFNITTISEVRGVL